MSWIDKLPKPKVSEMQGKAGFMIRLEDEVRFWLLEKSQQLEVSANKILQAIVKEAMEKDIKKK